MTFLLQEIQFCSALDRLLLQVKLFGHPCLTKITFLVYPWDRSGFEGEDREASICRALLPCLSRSFHLYVVWTQKEARRTHSQIQNLHKIRGCKTTLGARGQDPRVRQARSIEEALCRGPT